MWQQFFLAVRKEFAMDDPHLNDLVATVLVSFSMSLLVRFHQKTLARVKPLCLRQLSLFSKTIFFDESAECKQRF